MTATITRLDIAHRRPPVTREDVERARLDIARSAAEVDDARARLAEAREAFAAIWSAWCDQDDGEDSDDAA